MIDDVSMTSFNYFFKKKDNLAETVTMPTDLDTMIVTNMKSTNLAQQRAQWSPWKRKAFKINLC